MTQTANSRTRMSSEKSIEARKRLTDAALMAFGDKGFHGTTTRDISKTAGMSPAAVYGHYSSKEELLFTLCFGGTLRTLEVVEEAANTSEAPAAKLVAIMQNFVMFHATEHTLARVVNYEMAHLTVHHLDRVVDVRRAIDKTLLEVVDEGVATGDFDCRNTRFAATALSSLGIDVARWYADNRGWTPESLAREYSKIALRIVGASDLIE